MKHRELPPDPGQPPRWAKHRFVAKKAALPRSFAIGAVLSIPLWLLIIALIKE